MDTIRRGEDAGFSRRSLRLLCGGWLPHDDGASEGCPALATDVSVVGAVQNKIGGSLYRWPFSYWGQHVDNRVAPQNPDLVAKAIVPDYALATIRHHSD